MLVKEYIKALAQRVANEDCPSFIGLKGPQCEHMGEDCVACWEQTLTRIATEEGIGLATKDPKGLKELELKEGARRVVEAIAGREMTSDEYAIFSMTYGIAMFDAYSLWKDQLGEEVGHLVVWTDGKTIRKYVGQDTHFKKQEADQAERPYMYSDKKTPARGYYKARAVLYREG